MWLGPKDGSTPRKRERIKRQLSSSSDLVSEVIWHHFYFTQGYPGGSVVKNLPANVGDTGLIPGSGRSPGEGNGNPFWYSCLENPMDRGVWQATVHRVAKNGIQPGH